MSKPLCIDLFCGLGGWAEGFLSEGWDVVGFDIERHDYGTGGYPGQLVLQDVLTLDGRQFKGRAAVIVASPPCQEFSYMAMPWSRAKQIARALRGEDQFPEPYTGSRSIEELTRLFRASFRIAQEAGIPIVVENVKGAQPWVGDAQAHFGSFYFWGDINSVGNAVAGPKPRFGEVVRAAPKQKHNPDGTEHGQGSWFKIADSKNRGSKNDGGSWFAIGSPGQTNVGQNPDGRKVAEYSDPRRNGGRGAHLTSPRENDNGLKEGGDWFGPGEDCSSSRRCSSKSPARKAASAQIAKIPFPLAQHIAKVFKP